MKATIKSSKNPLGLKITLSGQAFFANLSKIADHLSVSALGPINGASLSVYFNTEHVYSSAWRGSIEQQIRNIASLFGGTIHYHDRNGKKVTLEGLVDDLTKP
jgi:hypothetical protein